MRGDDRDPESLSILSVAQVSRSGHVEGSCETWPPHDAYEGTHSRVACCCCSICSTDAHTTQRAHNTCALAHTQLATGAVFFHKKHPLLFSLTKFPHFFSPRKLPPGQCPRKLTGGMCPSKLPPRQCPSKLPFGQLPGKLPFGPCPCKLPGGSSQEVRARRNTRGAL